VILPLTGRDLGYLTSGNVAYNFRASEALVPFVLAGAGLGNGLAYMGIVDGRSAADSIALHLGAGIKYLVGTAAALRLEYRYTHYRISETMLGVSHYDAHQILGGASVFF